MSDKEKYTAGTYSKLVEAEEQKKKTASPTPPKEPKEEERDTTTPRHRDTTQPSYQDATIETIRGAVKQLGKEAATHRFTQKEKKDLADIVYRYKGEGIRTSENEITRISINFLVEDYQRNGKDSILARVLERLNAWYRDTTADTTVSPLIWYKMVMQSVKEILERDTIVILNEALKHGFTQLPNYVLKDKNLSFGARLAYAVLLSYAWQEGSCFPGQDRMAQDLGISRRMVSSYLKELKKAGYIGWQRRGLNKTNVYFILDYKPLDRKIRKDVKWVSHQDAKPS